MDYFLQASRRRAIPSSGRVFRASQAVVLKAHFLYRSEAIVIPISGLEEGFLRLLFARDLASFF